MTTLLGPMPMSLETAALTEAGTGSTPARERDGGAAGPWPLLLLVGWCGLVAGLLEVAVVVFRKQTFDLDRLAPITHHFVWLVPAADLTIFLVLGLMLAPLLWWGLRGAGWRRVCCAR